jgi:hypothetical protein
MCRRLVHFNQLSPDLGGCLAISLAANGTLELRTWPERWALASRDNDSLAGLRVAALTSCPFGDPERTESGDRDFLTRGQAVADCIESGIYYGTDDALRLLDSLSDIFDQVLLTHKNFLP